MWRQALDVVSKMLAYDPLKRIKPLEVCSHDFVDEVNYIQLKLKHCLTAILAAFGCALKREMNASEGHTAFLHKA